MIPPLNQEDTIMRVIGKSKCDEYKKPLKGNICGYRGRLCDYGESVTFNVATGEII